MRGKAKRYCPAHLPDANRQLHLRRAEIGDLVLRGIEEARLADVSRAHHGGPVQYLQPVALLRLVERDIDGLPVVAVDSAAAQPGQADAASAAPAGDRKGTRLNSR